MNINELKAIVKKKLKSQIRIENIEIEDKTFLHKKHSGFQEGKFHLKLTIDSKELIILGKINGTKKIYKILDEELKQFIHSIQILFR